MRERTLVEKNNFVPNSKTESATRAAGGLRAVMQMTSGGVLPKRRQDFAGTYCAFTISNPAARTVAVISERVNLQPRQVSLCVTASRMEARMPAGRPKKCQRATPAGFRTRWLSLI